MKRDAVISPCGRYRYELSRQWVDPGDSKADAYAVFIMLNPSTADHQQDDPTIRRCIDFAKRWGMGGLMVVNLFAWRATNPDELYGRVQEHIGPDNDRHIIAACSMAQVVVAAWGAHPLAVQRGAAVRKMVGDLHYLRLTRDGHPAHPLYLPKSLEPTPWR